MTKALLILAAAAFIFIDVAGDALKTTTVAGALVALALLLPWDLQKLWREYNKHKASMEDIQASQAKVEEKLKALDERITTVSNASHMARFGRGNVKGN